MFESPPFFAPSYSFLLRVTVKTARISPRGVRHFFASTAPFFLSGYLYKSGVLPPLPFVPLSLVCSFALVVEAELFPRLGFRILAARFISHEDSRTFPLTSDGAAYQAPALLRAGTKFRRQSFLIRRQEVLSLESTDRLASTILDPFFSFLACHDYCCFVAAPTIGEVRGFRYAEPPSPSPPLGKA